MRRGIAVAFAVLASVLVLTAMPVSATNTAVGSINTTATDFNNAQTLSGVHVEGSGDAASVVTDSGTTGFSDDFETGSIAGWTGDTGSYSATTETSQSGSYSLRYGGGSAATLEHTFTAGAYDRSTVYLNYSGTDSVYPLLRMQSGATKVMQIGISDGSSSPGDAGSVIWYDGSSYTDTGIDTSPGHWYNLSIVNAAYGTNTYDIVVRFGTNGTVAGTYSGADFRNAAASIDTINLRGFTDVTYWDDIAVVDSDAVSFPATYVGQVEAVGNATTAWANLTLTDSDAIFTVENATSGASIASTTVSTTGNYTLDISSATTDQFQVNVTFVQNGTSPVGELHDEGILFENHAPEVDNSSASPTGVLSTATPTFSINVSDHEFGLPQGDSVDVELFVDNSSRGTDTLTANGTAEISASVSGGNHTYHFVATDSYGGSINSSYFDVRTPGTLFIRNESNSSQLVDGGVVDIEFYVTNGTQVDVYTRNTTNGAVNMSGLPPDQPFVVVAKTDGYVNRRIFVESLYSTQTIYLIPDSATTVEPTFQLVDYSGDFPRDTTVLEVRRLINESQEVVEGDYFGAVGTVSTHLAFNERHYLRLINTASGETRELGPFTPTTSGTFGLEVFANGSVSVVGEGAQAVIEPSVGSLEATTGQSINATFVTNTADFSSYSFDAIYQYTNGTNVTIATLAGSDANGEELNTTLDLSGLEGGRVFLEASWALTDGTSGSSVEELVVTSSYANDYSILSVLSGVTGRLPVTTRGQFTTFLAIMLTALVTGYAATKTPLGVEAVGFVAVAFIATFVIIQWLDRNVLFIAAMSWVGVVALRRRL